MKVRGGRRGGDDQRSANFDEHNVLLCMQEKESKQLEEIKEIRTKTNQNISRKIKNKACITCAPKAAEATHSERAVLMTRSTSLPTTWVHSCEASSG